MQLVNCLVTLGGGPNQHACFEKYDVSVPEILLLEAIHGEGCVSNVKVTKTVKRGAVEELDRLILNYPSQAETIARIYPGRAPNMPMTVDEAGLKTVAPPVPSRVGSKKIPKEPPAPEAPRTAPTAIVRGEKGNAAPAGERPSFVRAAAPTVDPNDDGETRIIDPDPEDEADDEVDLPADVEGGPVPPEDDDDLSKLME